MGCLPFSEALYRDLQQQGLDAGDLWNEPNRYGRERRWFRNSEALEEDLLGKILERVTSESIVLPIIVVIKDTHHRHHITH